LTYSPIDQLKIQVSSCKFTERKDGFDKSNSYNLVDRRACPRENGGRLSYGFYYEKYFTPTLILPPQGGENFRKDSFTFPDQVEDRFHENNIGSVSVGI